MSLPASLRCAVRLLLPGLAAMSALPVQAGDSGCRPIPARQIAFQLATVMPGFMPPGAIALPNPDPARMRAGTANPPLPQLAPDPARFAAMLAGLRAAGFRNMERFGGTLMLPGDEYARILAQSGIRVFSSHGSLEQPEWSAELDRAQALGQAYVGSWGFGPFGFDTYENVIATAALLDRRGREAAARGLRLIVHDHQAGLTFRYPDKRSGRGRTEPMTAWEIVAARTDPRFVKFEVDIHWARKALGSEDALVAFLRRNRGRIELLHLKGTMADGTITDLGRGMENLPRIIAAAGTGVRYYIWEYERPADPLRSARIAYDALRCR